MIVVTTPTGNVGRQVLQHVLKAKRPVRVIVRNPSALGLEFRDSVEVVPGSHSDPEVLSRAFRGAEAVFWLVPPDPRAISVRAAYVDFTVPAAEALRSQKVKRVVGISALGRGAPQAAKAGLVTGVLEMDELIASTGVSYRAVACPSFMENIVRQVAAIKNQGVLFSPIDGDRKLPTCSTRDIAAVSARLLMNDSWTGVGRVSLLGPEDLSFNDMARIISDVIGKPVRFQQISFDAYKSAFIQRGTSEAIAQAMVDMAAAKNKGLDDAEPRTPENSAGTSFRQWCREVLEPAVQT